jgi:NAD(P)H-dependent flavin oxidoreductase YrpB (nitropropane dioxygenase family)
MERFINVAGDGDYYTKRRKLFDAMWETAKQYSGNPNLPKEDGQNLSINQLVGLMQGVKDEGLVLVDKDQENILLGDFISETSMPNEKLDAFIDRIIEKTEKLKKARALGKQFEFAYTTGDEVYFWIPVEDSF